MKSSAFTLIELIVVIAIITLLMALSSLVSSRARRVARMTSCQANIKNLITDLHTYDAANQTLPLGFTAMQKPPPPGGYPGSPAFNLSGWYWFNYTETVAERTDQGYRIIECPAKNLQDPWLQRDVLVGNYGANRALCRSGFDLSKYQEAFGGPPLPVANIRRPAEILMLVDSGYTLTCWWQARDDPLVEHGGGLLVDTAYIPGMEINKERILEQGQLDDAIGGRHPNKRVNVGFADGHVESKKADDLLVKKTGEDQYTNRTPLWEQR
jgi:prepilin-type processing-associated H-X9-DG protein/prepilin-type N-terminal cleavage/methylation domain-containing protein